MGKTIDISGRLTNERPKIKIAEDKIYEIDDRKNTVLKLNKKMEEVDTDSIESIDQILELTLGKKAVKEISDLNPPFVFYQDILAAVMAAVMGESLEVMEERFRQE